MANTPVTPKGLQQFDNHDAVTAVIEAWTIQGNNPAWHQEMQKQVAVRMPVLARALDRLVKETNSKEKN